MMKRYGGFNKILLPLVGMFLLALLLFIKQGGMRYDIIPSTSGFIPVTILNAAEPNLTKECIVLYNSNEDNTKDVYKNINYVLSSMRVNFDSVDLALKQFPKLNQYRTAILSFADISTVQQSFPVIFDWVNQGGRLLFAISMEPSIALSEISNKLGITQKDTQFVIVNKVQILTDFMLGGKGNEYIWGNNNRYALAEQLDSTCTIHLKSVEDTEVPLLWEKEYGKGRIIVNNNDAFSQKQSRGLIATVYSLLDDVCVYPVINASMFSIDDFPAPISDGYNEWIYRDYKMSTDSFYTNIWFANIMMLGKKYNLSFTGMLLEAYDDNIVSPFVSTKNTDRMKYFGDLLLKNNHEIGMQGYNHQPLVLQGFYYPSTLDYNKWNSVEDMRNATAEAMRFSKELFPKLEIKSYIPPSYILSKEAREMIKKHFPQITAISCSYLGYQDGLPDGQEFDVGDDGIINVPHLISSSSFDDDARWLAINEINFHYINSLILDPTIILDPKYGETKGWENSLQSLDQYFGWLFDSAKGIRNVTMQEGAMSVQRYCNLRVHKTIADGKIEIKLWGLYDDAWFLMRCRMGKLSIIKGGTVSSLNGDLYLLHATDKVIELTTER
jgi:hypothetical protein